MTTKTYTQLLKAIREHSGLELEAIRDAGEHGADSGFAGFTYYSDTSEFVAKHREIIMDALADDACEFGYASIPEFVATFSRADMAIDETGFDCLIAWYAPEAVGRMLNDRREARC